MSKFYVGQKVLVKSDTFSPCPGATAFIGRIGYIKYSDYGHIQVWNESKTEWYGFNPSDVVPIEYTPETLTINGATYVRKPNHEHKWKFGDIAVHEYYGVGIVFGVEKDGSVCFKEQKTLRMLFRPF